MDLQPTMMLTRAQSLESLYPVLAQNRMTAGWHKKRPSLWPHPRTAFTPLLWRYDLGREALDRAGQWMDTEMAERRNVLLFNPVGDNDYASLPTLVAAYQMLKPGEHARAHRHTPNAMRFVLDAAEGAFSVVDGVKLPMLPGDVLLTPGHAWHSHFNEGTENAYWIDVLDVPLVHRLEPMFWDDYPGGYQDVQSTPDAHPFRFSTEDAAAMLATAPAKAGVRRMTLPSANVMRTMGIGYLAIATGAASRGRRSTSNRVFAVAAGRGRAHIGDQTLAWQRGDVVAVPQWQPYRLEADDAALLLEVSDEPVMRALGYWREQEA